MVHDGNTELVAVGKFMTFASSWLLDREVPSIGFMIF